MSTDPLDPVFPDPVVDSVPSLRDDGLPEYGDARSPQRDATVGATSAELGTIADAIEELQGRLAQANAELAQAGVEDATEYEIGRIFAETQRFAEGCLSKLEMQIRGILFEVEVKAAEILREADEEATEILRRAQRASCVAETKLNAADDRLTPTAGVGSDSPVDPIDNATNR